MQTTTNLIALGPHRDRKSAEQGKRGATGFSASVLGLLAPGAALAPLEVATCGECGGADYADGLFNVAAPALKARGWTIVRHLTDPHDWDWRCPACSAGAA